MSFSPELDVHEELSGAAVGRSHRILGALITLITMFDGYDTFNPAYVIHYVMQPWGLVPSQAGLLVSSGLMGFLVAAVCHGMVADRFNQDMDMIRHHDECIEQIPIAIEVTQCFADNLRRVGDS